MSIQQPSHYPPQTQPPIPQDSYQIPGYQPQSQLPQQEYSLPPGSYGYQLPLPQDPGRGAALAGLILGIAGLFFFPAAIAGLILSIIGLRSVSRKRFAVIGLVLSGLVVVVIVLAAIVGVFSAPH